MKQDTIYLRRSSFSRWEGGGGGGREQQNYETFYLIQRLDDRIITGIRPLLRAKPRHMNAFYPVVSLPNTVK